MPVDIGQELYEKIKAEFDKRVSANGYIKAVTKRIAEGTATMNDVSLYAKALGSEVRLAIAYSISAEVLPEGQMFYNIAQKILSPMLHDNHSMVNDIAAEVQKVLDDRHGIRIKPQKAEFPEDRLGSVLSAASEQGLDEATMKRRMSAPAETMTQSFADDYMKENAKFRTRAGFKEYIVRKDDGKCCEWCSKLAGRYLYPESTPHDVFRRHDNCGCTVTYEDGEMRTRQQVWSKRDWSDEEEQKYLEASDKHKRTMAAMKEDLRLYREGKLSPGDANISYQESRRALANIRNLRDRTPVKFTPAQAEALENLALANSARAKNPIDISAESGIIRERANRPITAITDQSIKSVPVVEVPGYSYEESMIIQQQHKELLDFSRENNNNGECSFTFREGFSDRKRFIGTDDSVDFGSDGLNGSNIFVMHNHPRNSSYSDRDVRFLLNNENIRALSIVKNNGHVEVLVKNQDFSIKKAKTELGRFFKKYVMNNTDEEIDKAINAFIKSGKGGLIWITK